jgi:hypothetical protein
MATGSGFCPNCGTPKTAPEQKFCPTCGAALVAIAAPVAAPPPPPPAWGAQAPMGVPPAPPAYPMTAPVPASQPQSGISPTVLLLGLLLIVAVAGGAFLYTNQNSKDPGASAAATPRPAPTGPADKGLGRWSYADNREVVTVLFDPKGTNDLAKAAEACRVAMNGAPVVWIIVSAENKTGDQMRLSSVTIVSGDGQQLNVDNAVTTLGDWYVNAPESPAREACVETASKVAKSQIESGVAPGATVVALESVPATVTSVKWVTAYGYGDQLITLSYGF